MRFTRRQQLVYLLPLAIVLVPFLLAPAVFGFFASFTTYAPLQFHPQFVGLKNYANVLGDTQFQSAVRNISLFTLVAVPFELTLGFGIAYLLRAPFRGRSVVRIVLLLPWLVSPIANGVMWHFLFAGPNGLFHYFAAWLPQLTFSSPLGMPGLTFPIVVALEIWRETPLVAFLVLPALITFPNDLLEQATLDGVTLLQRIRYVVLPDLSVLLLTIGLLLTGSTLGLFDTILILTGGGPGTETLTPGFYSYFQAFQIHDWSLGTASAWLIVGAVLFIGLVYMRLVPTEPSL